MGFKELYESLFKEDQAIANQREIAKHMAKVLLWELKGIKALHPMVREKAILLINKCSSEDLKISITETFRSASIQQNYYDQGRKSPGSIITNAQPLESYHQYGLAFDIRFEGPNPYPSNMDIWKKVGNIGESVGLIWGGRFNDNPHFELHQGFTWKDIKDYFKRYG